MAFDFKEYMANPWTQVGLGILSQVGSGRGTAANVGTGGLLGIQNYQEQLAFQHKLAQAQREKEDQERILAAQSRVAEQFPELGPLLQAYPNAAPALLAAQSKGPDYGNTPLYFQTPEGLKVGRFAGASGVDFPQIPAGYEAVKPMNFQEFGGYTAAFPYGSNSPTGTYIHTPPPEQMPGFKSAQTAATTEAQRGVERQFDLKAGRVKALGALNTFKRQTGIAVSALNDVKKMYDPSVPYTPEFLARFPTKLKSIMNKIETAKRNIGFQAISEMRSNSPTGGALGNVAVQELEGLQGVLGTLDPKDPEFINTVDSAIKLLESMQASSDEAYALDYGASIDQGGQSPTRSPPAGGGFKIIGESK